MEQGALRETRPTLGSMLLFETKGSYRADTDQSGEWYVWRRLSANGWATMQRCDSREEAVQLASDLNRTARAG